MAWDYDARTKALIPDAVKVKVDSLGGEMVAGRIVAPSH